MRTSFKLDWKGDKHGSCLSTILICLLGLSDWIGLGEALYGIILGFHQINQKQYFLRSLETNYTQLKRITLPTVEWQIWGLEPFIGWVRRIPDITWIGLALLLSVQQMSNKKDLEAIYFIKTMKDLELSLVHGVIVSILYLCLFLGAAQLGPITILSPDNLLPGNFHPQDPLNGRVGHPLLPILTSSLSEIGNFHRQDPLNGWVGQWTGARLCDWGDEAAERLDWQGISLKGIFLFLT